MAETIILVLAFVKVAGESSIVFVVGGNIGIQKVHRDFKTGGAFDDIFPDLDIDFPILNKDGSLSRYQFEVIVDAPIGGLGVLVAFFVDLLKKVAVLVEHGDGDEGYFEVGAGFDGVAGQDAQSPTISRNRIADADFHTEISDGEF